MMCRDYRAVDGIIGVCEQTGRIVFCAVCRPGRECYRPDDGQGGAMVMAVIGWALIAVAVALIVLGIYLGSAGG